MQMMFWGLLFVMFDFWLRLPGGAVEILPDVIGYILVIFGMFRLEREEPCTAEPFKQGKVLAAVLFLVSLAETVFGVTGLNMGNWPGLWGALGSLASQAVVLVLVAMCIRQIVRGIVNIEKEYKQDLRGDLLIQGLSMFVAANLLAIVLSAVPALRGDLLTIALFAIKAVAAFLFLSRLFSTNSLYRANCKKDRLP